MEIQKRSNILQLIQGNKENQSQLDNDDLRSLIQEIDKTFTEDFSDYDSGLVIFTNSHQRNKPLQFHLISSNMRQSDLIAALEIAKNEVLKDP